MLAKAPFLVLFSRDNWNLASLLQQSSLPRWTLTTAGFLCQKEEEKQKHARAFSNLPLGVCCANPFLQYRVTLFSLMDCNKQQQQCNHESAKYLETPKGILVSFSPLCSESSYWNAWSVFSVIYRGSLKALASCLFCMVFAKKKMPLAWGIFYFFFFICLQLWTSRGPHPSPSSFFS